MKIYTTVGMALMATLLLLSGCEQEGPAERAGEKVDAAVQDSESAAKDAVEEAGDKLEQAGDKVERQTQ